MTSDSRSVHEDLAFLRSLVDEDWRPGAWLFGSIYVLVGAALMAHVLISWAAGAGYVPLQGASLVATYVALYGVVSIVWMWLWARMRREGRSLTTPSVSVKSRAIGSALGSAFLGHFVMMGVLVIVAVRQDNRLFLHLTPLVLFTLQSVVWFVLHSTSRLRWQLVVAWGWLLAVLALAALVGTDAFDLGIAATAVALMIVPGVYMLRAARTPA